LRIGERVGTRQADAVWPQNSADAKVGGDGSSDHRDGAGGVSRAADTSSGRVGADGGQVDAILATELTTIAPSARLWRYERRLLQESSIARYEERDIELLPADLARTSESGE
jgi:hypothetical protein